MCNNLSNQTNEQLNGYKCSTQPILAKDDSITLVPYLKV